MEPQRDVFVPIHVPVNGQVYVSMFPMRQFAVCCTSHRGESVFQCNELSSLLYMYCICIKK